MTENATAGMDSGVIRLEQTNPTLYVIHTHTIYKRLSCLHRFWDSRYFNHEQMQSENNATFIFDPVYNRVIFQKLYRIQVCNLQRG